MERAAGLVHDDTPQTRLDKLDAVLAQTSTSVEDIAFFAEMLSLSNDGRYPAFELALQQRREKTLRALVSQIEVLTRQGPVLMIFDHGYLIRKFNRNGHLSSWPGAGKIPDTFLLNEGMIFRAAPS
jgi:hypothetical protein